MLPGVVHSSEFPGSLLAASPGPWDTTTSSLPWLCPATLPCPLQRLGERAGRLLLYQVSWCLPLPPLCRAPKALTSQTELLLGFALQPILHLCDAIFVLRAAQGNYHQPVVDQAGAAGLVALLSCQLLSCAGLDPWHTATQQLRALWTPLERCRSEGRAGRRGEPLVRPPQPGHRWLTPRCPPAADFQVI